VELETGANISVEVFPADESDASTLKTSLKKAKENIEVVKTSDDDDDPPAATSRRNEVKMEVVADKGYHKAELLLELKAAGFRTYIPERNQAGQRHWQDKGGERTARAVYQNRARVSRKKSKALQRRRGELVERPFAHICETGGHRRTRLRGIENMKKRYVIQVAGANLGLIMRTLHRWGTPRGLADAGRAALWLLYALSATWSALRRLFRARPYPQPARVIAPVLTGRMVAVSTGC
jgi:transposase